MIPDASREEIQHALERFDRELRDGDEWRDWEDNANHKYAIEHDGRRYPVKQVVSLATGTPRSSFSGGDEANRFAEQRGFQIIELEHEFNGLRALLEDILQRYNAPDRGPIGKENPVWKLFDSTADVLNDAPPVAQREHLQVRPSVGQGNWAKVPWIALMDERETTSTQHGVYVVFLFAEDMSSVYLTLNQGVTQVFSDHKASKAREVLQERADRYRQYCGHLEELGFRLDSSIDLKTKSSLGRKYENSTVAHKRYDRDAVPGDDELVADLEAVLNAYDDYLEERPPEREGRTPVVDELDGEQVAQVVDWIRAQGFYFEPWQVATYITAARTKPFILLAGVSGTGKSKLPELVAAATGSESTIIPVRPDWTDSADVLGYRDLQGEFQPGQLLRIARAAEENPDRHYVSVIDEMNLARVEYYFAEILSRIEDDPEIAQRRPLVTAELAEEDREWSEVSLPPNLLLAGTVNMDETTHGFSKKVLDRAFTIEFSRVYLSEWQEPTMDPPPITDWSPELWQPRARRLAGLDDASDRDRELISSSISVLEEANEYLQLAQLQVGYRVRDELALFRVHAEPLREVFVDAEDQEVDPLDIGLTMKLLPRISGGSQLIRRLLRELLGWARNGSSLSDDDAAKVVRDWEDAGAGDYLPDARFPRMSARLALMWSRLESEGFTSFWL